MGSVSTDGPSEPSKLFESSAERPLTRRAFALGAGSLIATTFLEKAAWANEDDKAFIEVAAREFELDSEWYVDDGSMAPADANLANDRRAVIAEVLRDIRQRIAQGEPPYFIWAEDAVSPDVRHLTEPHEIRGGPKTIQTCLCTDSFELSHRTLERMAKANFFDLSPARRSKVVFALRGCEVVRSARRSEPSVVLREAIPDHRDYHCVVGVWDRRQRTVAAFTASTVPLELHAAIYQQAIKDDVDPRLGRWPTNMMPQGLHRKRVGTMWASRSQKSQWPLTLLQSSPTPVLRAHSGDAYAVSSSWDPFWKLGDKMPKVRLVGDHFHAGIFHGRRHLRFTSQGCQTIPGRYIERQGRKVGTSDLADFHRAMGFGRTTLRRQNGREVWVSPNDGEEVMFMLLSGREARLHAQGVDLKWLYRIRIGSSLGPAAGAKERLGDTSPGGFGSEATLRLLDFQRRMELPTDAVVTPSLAQRLRVKFPT